MEKSWNCVFEFLWEPCSRDYQRATSRQRVYKSGSRAEIACELSRVMVSLLFCLFFFFFQKNTTKAPEKPPVSFLGRNWPISNCILFWFGLLLYFPVNSYGHVGTVSSCNHTFFPGKFEQVVNQYVVHILSLSCNWQQPFLNESAELRRMTIGIILWWISTKVWDGAGIELAAPGSAVRHASVVRHVTNCATPTCSSAYYIICLQRFPCYPHAFLKKASGRLQSPPSVRPSVRHTISF